MEIVLQIFTGGYKEPTVTYEEIEKKLLEVLGKIPVHKVIIGWAVQEKLYRRVNALLRMYGVESYLWLPVFSENGLLKPVRMQMDYEGNPVESYRLKEGENFEFYCPNEAQNVDSLLEIYEDYFAEAEFDGIFLDKIRYGSFANGRNGVFSCFCPKCTEKYEKAGIDILHLKEEMKKVGEGTDGYDKSPLGIRAYRNGAYDFQDEIWEQFFEEKAESIYEALQRITGYFRQKGKKIGMDTFSPFMAYFVGQDFERLGKITDFVKPMMYRITEAPAGLPFEYESFMRETTGKKTHRRFSMDFVQSELGIIGTYDIPVYCGIEVNRIEKVAEADGTYIREMLKGLEQAKIGGVVLAWDLLSAPEENIRAVEKYMGEKGEVENGRRYSEAKGYP